MTRASVAHLINDDGTVGLRGQSGVPSTGWEFVGVIDLVERDGPFHIRSFCEWCGPGGCRYYQTMRHEDYDSDVQACPSCAGKMAGDSRAARIRLESYRDRANRLRSFIERAWRTSNEGNPERNIPGGGWSEDLYPDSREPQKWRFYVKTERSGTYHSKDIYDTQFEAKFALFFYRETGEHREDMRRRMYPPN